MIGDRMTRSIRALSLLMAVAAVALATTACGSSRIKLPASTPGTQVDTKLADYTNAANVFNQRCGGCHTLSAAGSFGSGPNPRTYLTISGPSFNQRCERPATRVLYAIENGGFSGEYMPANIVTGQLARQMADFVAEFSGRQAPLQPGSTPCEQQKVGRLPPLPTAPASNLSTKP
jgi:mono/diheme cytochrome c family protein